REANRLHVAPRLFPIPPSLLSAALKMLGKSAIADQLCGDLEVDGSAAAAILPKHIGSSH
ncbi:MAG: hypothetical protein P8J20_08855, partial [Novosphingobium sp.]|nr:hypothetical protein [Novosphingobium sp.]